ncbi:TlpA family protein disulfide reductase [Solimonas variicoloris]|uniref:TlpA family protein disulfide reductase n=1 Tax=Solimonas variicoloris TaxID=254408 RepID=UPI0003A997A2|nr:TlpA disulfide reductase family protein [Solimonas variicoloris]
MTAALLAGPAAAAPAVGELPPDALGDDRDGQAVRASDFRGRILITTFWASWCGPCLRELTLLERLQQVVGRERLAVVGVNWKEDRARYQEILRRLAGLQLTLTHDPRGRIGARYGVEAIPRLFLVDADGRVAYTHTGYDPETSLPRLVDEINRLLPRLPSAGPAPAGASPAS